MRLEDGTFYWQAAIAYKRSKSTQSPVCDRLYTEYLLHTYIYVH